MKKIIALLVVSCFLIGCGKIGQDQRISTSESYSVTDAQGKTVEMIKKPERILTLAMTTDIIILGMLPPERLVAVDTLLDDPTNSTVVELAKQIPEKLSDQSTERIVSLKPDLVIASPWTSPEQVDMLRDLGLKVIVCNGGNSISEVEVNIDLIAKAIGEPAKGQKMIAIMEEKLQEIKEKVAEVSKEYPRKTTVLLSLMNNYGGIGSAFDSMCKLAGVTNGLAMLGIQNGQSLTKEMLVKINPDFLLMPSYNDHGKVDTDKFIREYIDDPALQTMTAIEQKNFYKPREFYIYNSSQDIVFGVQEIALAAYGATFAQPDNCHISVIDYK